MRIAFRTGGTVGMATVGLGLLGASVVVLLYKGDAPKVLEGFGFGAALLAMFMRVGGGIFTKAADVGADLVGKVEAGIPEDDPRNAATIADNVGDNVGDCAGMAADLFESYAVTLVAALILGSAAFGEQGLVFPLLIPGHRRAHRRARRLHHQGRARGENGLTAINRGFYISAAVSAVLCGIAAYIYLPATFARADRRRHRRRSPWRRGRQTRGCSPPSPSLLGIVLAGDHPVADRPLHRHRQAPDHGRRPHLADRRGHRRPLRHRRRPRVGRLHRGRSSAARSTRAFLLGGGSIALSLFLIALAGCGLLTTVGVIVAMDTFGPVSDNAQGIAEMSGDVDEEGAQILTDLDAVGNTTKAITKGIAIATAVLAATALFGSYTDAWQTAVGDRSTARSPRQPSAVRAVDVQPADRHAERARRPAPRRRGGVPLLRPGDQRGHPRGRRHRLRGAPPVPRAPRDHGLHREAGVRPRRRHLHQDSLRELATPGLLAALAPIAVGFGLGIGPLAGYLAGAIGTGVPHGGVPGQLRRRRGTTRRRSSRTAHYGGKGSEAHAATVIGDTVGDPFKDTAGPAINPLIKVMNLVSVLIAPAIVHADRRHRTPRRRCATASPWRRC